MDWVPLWCEAVGMVGHAGTARRGDDGVIRIEFKFCMFGCNLCVGHHGVDYVPILKVALCREGEFAEEEGQVSYCVDGILSGSRRPEPNRFLDVPPDCLTRFTIWVEDAPLSPQCSHLLIRSIGLL